MQNLRSPLPIKDVVEETTEQKEHSPTKIPEPPPLFILIKKYEINTAA